jgi:putative aldouronate transport system permease protein
MNRKGGVAVQTQINNRIKDTTGDRIFNAFCYTMATSFLLIVLYPLYYILIASISDPFLVITGQVWLWPRGIDLEGYERVLGNASIMRGYGNTIYYTVTSTILGLAVTLPCGYALSKKMLPGRSIVMGYIMIPVYFSGGLIPTFLLIRDLGLVDTRSIMILLGCVSFMNVVVSRTFFAAMPGELEEAALIDGCSITKSFLLIVLPLSKALISVLSLWLVVGNWNSWFGANIYLRSERLWPLQLVLRRILIMNIPTEDTQELAARADELVQLIRYSSIVVSSLPVLVLYPFLQKYFDKGVMLGSIKG